MAKRIRQSLLFIVPAIVLVGAGAGFLARETIGDAFYSTFIYRGSSADKHNVSWPSLWTRNEETGWAVDSYPTIFLIDQQGRIVHFWNGGPPIEQLEDAIRALLD